MEIVPGSSGAPGDTASTVLLPRAQGGGRHGPRSPQRAPTLDENNQPAVSFTLNNEGGRKFGNVTGENIGRQLAIILDGRVQSAPRIDCAHLDRRPHHGQLHAARKCTNLSLILRSGRAAGEARLPARSGRSVRASARTRFVPASSASFVGLLLIVVFMLVYYKLSGVNAGRRARSSTS